MLAPLFILAKLLILLKILPLPPPIPRLLKARTDTGRFAKTWLVTYRHRIVRCTACKSVGGRGTLEEACSMPPTKREAFQKVEKRSPNAPENAYCTIDIFRAQNLKQQGFALGSVDNQFRKYLQFPKLSL